MTAKTTKNPANSAVADSGAKPPYAYRTGWAIFLLAINFLVAAYYFHIIE
ncbi:MULTISPECIES: photosystem I protein PsaX [Nostoc]|jgi:photosystem I protein|uniref:Photosystem one PsaX n=1 Tax=Nostoc punctiforme (strain ATCC 29133 / PCC 73102) TaxID=63737 RepID=B2J499_NOSP7|nr:MULTISPECIES: photosystem I protein PsaX [Nostoc]MBD2507137.1 photosystem I protein PsaX [Desmonostoc muscorum FACHB-395]ACC82211.1 photosystem one PsaX [Nostoc punctiforme PCC 73102]MBE8986198.1 photosystem I protein PsaX [Nostoc sp. LEGE 12450]MBE8999784.1 photosystem I protein PsaX [Nostoc sp. LEGE 12447]NEU80839.1 Photosystem I protein [Nostoc sp. UIC 10630]